MKTPLLNLSGLAVTCIMVCSPFFFFAQTWTSVQDGNWNNPATWGGSSYPPSTIGNGKTVNIHHTVTLKSNFTSNLSVSSGGAINITGGTFVVETGISMDNRGRFTGLNGSLLQCLWVGCSNSGSQASGVWNTLDGGYTRMENMNIQIAQDWATTNGGKRYHKNCCVKTGQNFSVNNEMNRDTLINTRFEIGLHGSGNFQQNKGKVVYDNIDIDIAGSGGGNVQFSDGTFQGTIRTIRIRSNNGNIQTSSSMTGTINLNYYCIQVPSNYQDPANKIRNEVRDCATVNYLLSLGCVPGIPEEEEGPRRPGPGAEEPVQATGVNMYPNPFVGNLRFQFTMKEAAPVTILLTDLSGRQVYTATREGRSGLNLITAENFAAIHPGLYIAEIRTASEVLVRNMLVKK